MKLLAIDASTEGCSVALQIDAKVISRQMIAPRGHAQHLLGMVDEVLNEAGVELARLDGLAFDRGPGSFTGVRISTSVCQGLAFGAALPVVGVSSLAAIAQGAWRERGETRVLAAIDARMNEIYAGWYVFTDGIMQAVSEEWIGKAELLEAHDDGQWFGAGTGWHSYAEQLSNALPQPPICTEGERLPLAIDLLALAQPAFAASQVLRPEQALPTYLRNEVTWKKSGV